MLQDLENNLKTLIAAYETQKSRADRLAKELEVSRRSQEAAQKKVKELEDKVDNLGLKTVFSPIERGNEEARACIDRLIKEIDDSLALLQ